MYYKLQDYFTDRVFYENLFAGVEKFGGEEAEEGEEEKAEGGKGDGDDERVEREEAEVEEVSGVGDAEGADNNGYNDKEETGAEEV